MSNKILTISIAAYNVEKSLNHTLDSLCDERFLNDVEILIIDDGSKDNTDKIAKEYEKKYPNTFKYVKKDNGGHGSTINKGIELATGKYFRVIDGDDWVDKDNFYKYIQCLKKINSDMVLTELKAITPNGIVLGNKVSGFEDGKVYFINQKKGINRITLHMLTIKTKLLKNANVHITENCFYVDLEFVVWASYLAQTVTYYSFPVYVYVKGGENQSTSKKNMIKNIQMQEKVSMHLVKMLDSFVKKGIDDNKFQIIFNNVDQIVGSTMRTYLLMENSSNKIKKYDKQIKANSLAVFKILNKDNFIKVLRSGNYFLVPVIRIMYRIWLKKNKN